MKIDLTQIPGHYNGKECFVHARACALDENRLILTMQLLDVAGSDVFSDLFVLRSEDCGRTWSEPVQDPAFRMDSGDPDIRRAGCDGTHLLHKATGTPIVLGHEVYYSPGGLKPLEVNICRRTWYSTYDLAAGCYRQADVIALPPEFDSYRHLGSGCTQFIEEEDGTLLVPIYMTAMGEKQSKCAVMRCRLDGTKLIFVEMSDFLEYTDVRGIGEPSIVKYGGKYYLTIRSDSHGLWAVSEDGMHFTEPTVWHWDNGTELPNYNTQQHWMTLGGKLYLVYTRKAGNNDHVFRHRAPLFAAEVDTESMTVRRHTEEIVIPERGARLGNFGVTNINDNLAVVTVTEWMQPAGCEKFGSDNALWVARVTE
jgi:hypothetical protein